jgi:hypothetical protein
MIMVKVIFDHGQASTGKHGMSLFRARRAGEA